METILTVTPDELELLKEKLDLKKIIALREVEIENFKCVLKSLTREIQYWQNSNRVGRQLARENYEKWRKAENMYEALKLDCIKILEENARLKKVPWYKKYSN